jgi:hypothetical protein
MAIEKQRETVRGQDKIYPSKDTTPVSYFLQPAPIFHGSTISQWSIPILNPLVD